MNSFPASRASFVFVGRSTALAVCLTLCGVSLGQARTWIEGNNESILMISGQTVSRSIDAGVTWNPISTVNNAADYFTRLADGSLLLTTSGGWVQSFDDGQNWSGPNSFGLTQPFTFQYGPIIEVDDGSWAYLPYFQMFEEGFSAQIIWSGDRGQNWSDLINFPTPIDGNLGLTEASIAQIGPHDYVAAIRADEGSGASDGFYMSHSQDGVQWSVPQPTQVGERGRMPLFYHIDDDYWLLSYREFVFPSTQFTTIRLSRDGLNWSEPHRFASGVSTNGFFVESNGEWTMFSNTYPANEIVRMSVDLDTLAGQLLPSVDGQYVWTGEVFGEWTDAANWSTIVLPNSTTATVVFGSTISSPTTVVADTVVTVNTARFDSATPYGVAGLGAVNFAAEAGEHARIEVLQGSHQFQVAVALQSDTDADVNSDSVLAFNNELSLNGHTLNIIGNGELKINNVLGGGGGGSVIVQSGTVSGSGTFNGDLQNQGGMISPGNRPGALAVAGNYTQGQLVVYYCSRQM